MARSFTEKQRAAAKAEFLRRLADDESGTQICRDAHMPNASTMWEWRKQDAAFDTACAAAREQAADAVVDKMAEIESDTLDGLIDPKAARAVLSSMQWRAEKMNHNRYGRLNKVEVTGNMDIGAAMTKARKRASAKPADG